MTTIHTVELVYTSPYCAGGGEDQYYTAAVFTTKERAVAFVEWAEKERKRIMEEAKRLPFARWKEIEVPDVLRTLLPSHNYDSDCYHFQYDDEFDLDPEFG